MDAVVQFLRIVRFVLLAVVLAAIAAFAGIVVVDTLGGPKPSDVSNVSYPNAAGVELLAYLNLRPGVGQFPAVILIPDRQGLNQDMFRLANRLADHGFTVIVPDVYRGTSAAFGPRAAFLSLTLPAERALDDLRTTLDYLLRQPRVNPYRIGVVGLGSGGKLALQFAAQNADITAVVNVYGEVITEPNVLSAINGPVLGIFGSQDWFIRPAQVEQFRAALESAGVEHQIKVYARASGFFAFPDITLNGSEANLAWRAMIDFFDAQLIPKPSDLPVERRGF